MSRREHDLKTWPTPWEAVAEGQKTYEVRKNDRSFRVGDVLILHKWDPETQKYGGQEPLRREVTYITHGPLWGVQDGYVVMALGKLDD